MERKLINVMWTRFISYEEVRNQSSCVYLHEWFGKVYYVGIVRRGTWFGGRYGKSYSHWIDGCLEHGAKLYLGTIDDTDKDFLDTVEALLIKRLEPPKNVRKPYPRYEITLSHSGVVPSSVRSW